MRPTACRGLVGMVWIVWIRGERALVSGWAPRRKRWTCSAENVGIIISGGARLRKPWWVRCSGLAAAPPPLQPQQLKPAAPQVLRDQVWLLRPPPSLRACVSEVVCVAVLDAMWYGRKLLWALEVASAQHQPPADPIQRLITDFLPVVGGIAPPALPTVGECSVACAAARF